MDCPGFAQIEGLIAKLSELLPKLEAVISTIPKRKKRLPVIIYSYERNKFEGINDEMVKEWSEAFPAVDILTQLKAMRIWIIANPDKKKSNWAKFIFNWLTKEQQRGGSIKSNKPSDSRPLPPPASSIPDKRELTEEEKQKNLKRLRELISNIGRDV